MDTNQPALDARTDFPASGYIRYPQLYSIFQEAMGATHEELRYWIKRGVIDSYQWDVKYSPMCELDKGKFLDPSLHFYKFRRIFIGSHDRLVYVRDLGAQRPLWTSDVEYLRKILLIANSKGLLRFYDFSYDEFCLGPFNSSSPRQMLWHQTATGQNYVENKDNFFLFEDILKVERVLFNRKFEECIEELNNPQFSYIYFPGRNEDNFGDDD